MMAGSTLGKCLSFALHVSEPLHSSTPSINNRVSSNIYIIPYQVFKLEPFLLAAVVFYAAFFWFGSKINRAKANTWFVSHSFFRSFVLQYSAKLSHLINIGVARTCWCMRLVRAGN